MPAATAPLLDDPLLEASAITPDAGELHWAYGDDIDVLPRIFDPAVTLAVMTRRLDAALQASIAAQLGGERGVSWHWRGGVDQALADDLAAHLPAEGAALIDDIRTVAEAMAYLFDTETIGVRLRTLEGAMCPRFHVDNLAVRLVATYAGPASPRRCAIPRRSSGSALAIWRCSRVTAGSATRGGGWCTAAHSPHPASGACCWPWTPAEGGRVLGMIVDWFMLPFGYGFMRRALMVEALDPGFLRVQGARPAWIQGAFMTLVVLSLVTGFQALGTLMAVGLMILPATLAHFWSRRLEGMAAVAAGSAMVDTAAAEAVRAELALDQPALTAYFGWLWDLLQLDLGRSLVSGEPMIQGTALVMGLMFVALNTAVDLICHWLDPRRREA